MTARDDFLSVPSAVEAEQSLLGGLLLDNDAVDRIGDLRAEHFYRADHAMLFTEILALVRFEMKCDALGISRGHGLEQMAP